MDNPDDNAQQVTIDEMNGHTIVDPLFSSASAGGQTEINGLTVYGAKLLFQVFKLDSIRCRASITVI